jgi:RHH-type proline utilization regulon transcriptional repressor/proline dehydrogenase/delta 1-pyrroline-5-carboxylate dehydrogenase
LDGIDPEGSYRAVSARLRPILDLAQVLPASVTFDMEQADLKDLTLMIFTRLLSEPAYRAYPHAGIAIQAYLKDSMADVTRLLEWLGRRRTPATIRLVKGAYWDSDMIRYRQHGWPPPVFEQKVETDAAYERISRTLLNHRDLARSAFGTHNLRSLAHAEAVAQAAHVPADAYEFQMIFGMAEPLQSAVVKAGRRVRIYTPVGELLPGMAYLVRRLLENTSNESFLRKRYGQSEPLELLLAPPNEDAASEGMHRDGRPTELPDRSDRFENEPHSDFSVAAARAAMEDALGRTASQFGGERDYPRPIGFSPTGEVMLSRNPSRPSELVGRTRCVSPSDVGALVQACSSARSAWSNTSPDRRADIMIAAADIIRRRRFELAAWEVWETGKAWREADADVAEAIDFLEFYARGMRRLGHPRRLGQQPGEVNHQVVSPRGLAAVIAPWNFPLAIPTGMVSAALVTGNAVLFKPSERALIVGSLLVEILTEAGVPAGVLQFMPGGPDIGAALVEHADIQVIAFTGSKNVGLRILAQAAHPAPGRRTITRVIAEMGGKNAIIVDETADLDEAVTGVVASFTGYQGQKCSACSRAVVHASVYDLFLQRLTAAVASLHIGPPESPGVRMGPMIDDRARQTVRRYIEIGKLEGRLVIERQAAGEGYFVGPAVFADIRPEHRLAQEEIFGPVLAVMKADSFEEALRLANDSSYALTGGIYSRSPANLLRARKDFDVGNLYINRPITGALVGRQPFGGHRLSGVGAKAGGDDYLAQFVITKVISENTLRRGFAPANDPSVE